MSIRFASDWFPGLPLAIGIGCALALGFAAYWRRRTLARVGDPAQLARMMASSSGFRRRLKSVLFVTGVVLVSIAFARPQREARVVWSKRGVDVVVAMDMSKSMLARDLYPDRLTRMTEEVELLLDQLESDRVAVVAFAGAATHFPLSEDSAAARSLFRAITTCPKDAQSRWPTWCAPSALAPGSNVGEAVLISRCILRPDLESDPGCDRVGGHGDGGRPLGYDDEALEPEVDESEELADRARVLVLFTDGEDQEGEAAAEIARAVELGIDVFIVGVGTTEGELIPEYDSDGAEIGWKKTEDGASFVTTRLDQASLRELAQVAGGESHYMWLDPVSFESAALVKKLRRLKQGDLDGEVKKEWTDVYEWPLFAGFMLLLIEATVSSRRRRVLYPEEQAK